MKNQTLVQLVNQLTLDEKSANWCSYLENSFTEAICLWVLSKTWHRTTNHRCCRFGIERHRCPSNSKDSNRLLKKKSTQNPTIVHGRYHLWIPNSLSHPSGIGSNMESSIDSKRLSPQHKKQERLAHT